MAKTPIIKPKFNLKESFGKGLGSIFGHIPSSMQLPILKYIKKLNPGYSYNFMETLIKKMEQDEFVESFLFKESKNYRPLLLLLRKNRPIKNYINDILKNRGEKKINLPRRMETLIRGQRNKAMERSEIDKGFVDWAKLHDMELDYLKSEDYKYDLALQRQKGETEQVDEKKGAEIIPFKKPEKYRGGLISLIS